MPQFLHKIKYQCVAKYYRLHQSAYQIKQIFMKLLQRNQMYDTRFSQSFGDFAASKNKMLATTRNSFASRTDNKLPQLNRSFSYSNAKNAKQKVGDLDQRLQELSKNLNELKLQTRESRRFTSFLREDLGERQLGDYRGKLMQKVNTLDKYAKMTKQINQEKTQLLKDDCQRLHDSSIELKRLLTNISQRVDGIQNAMGIYSAKEKHKI